MKSSDICKTAAELVGGDRAVKHGDTALNFMNIADIWNTILRAKARQAGIPSWQLQLDALDVANMLEAFKIARRYSGSHNIDDYVDGAGYAGCAGEIAERQAGERSEPDEEINLNFELGKDLEKWL